MYNQINHSESVSYLDGVSFLGVLFFPFKKKMGIYEKHTCLVEQFLWIPEGGIIDFPKAVLSARNAQEATKLMVKLLVKCWSKEGWPWEFRGSI